jgi:hypothetical protein
LRMPWRTSGDNFLGAVAEDQVADAPNVIKNTNNDSRTTSRKIN